MKKLNIGNKQTNLPCSETALTTINLLGTFWNIVHIEKNDCPAMLWSHSENSMLSISTFTCEEPSNAGSMFDLLNKPIESKSDCRQIFYNVSSKNLRVCRLREKFDANSKTHENRFVIYSHSSGRHVFICLHIGIDLQLTPRSFITWLQKLIKAAKAGQVLEILSRFEILQLKQDPDADAEKQDLNIQPRYVDNSNMDSADTLYALLKSNGFNVLGRDGLAIYYCCVKNGIAYHLLYERNDSLSAKTEYRILVRQHFRDIQIPDESSIKLLVYYDGNSNSFRFKDPSAGRAFDLFGHKCKYEGGVITGAEREAFLTEVVSNDISERLGSTVALSCIGTEMVIGDTRAPTASIYAFLNNPESSHQVQKLAKTFKEIFKPQLFDLYGEFIILAEVVVGNEPLAKLTREGLLKGKLKIKYYRYTDDGRLVPTNDASMRELGRYADRVKKDAA